MKRVLKTIGLLLGLVVVVIAGVAGVFVMRSGAMTKLEPHFAGTCTNIDTGGDSAEDIVIDHATGFAYISALDRKGLMSKPDIMGTIKRIDLKAETWSVDSGLSNAPSDLHPHGMSLFIGEDGTKRLFVISHPHNKPHTVEIFEPTDDNKWNHIGTIRDTLFTKPNDLAAVGPNQFYVANDSGGGSGFDRATEMMFGRALSTLAYYNGERTTAAASNTVGGGGIAVSADGRTVWVSETADRHIRVYGRDPVGGALTPLRVIDVASGADNIDVAPDGSLWVAAHPNSIALGKHFATGAPSPTQIFHIENPTGPQPKITEVYLNGGEQFSAGSVAAVYKGKMLMGSITERRVQVCTLPGAATP